MKRMKIKDARKISDDYGWEIKPQNAWAAFERLKHELGDAELLDEIAQAMSFDDLAETLAFICRMNDIEIPQLEGNAEEETDDFTDEELAAIEEADFKDSAIEVEIDGTPEEISDFCAKYKCNAEPGNLKNKPVDNKWPYELTGNRDDLKKAVMAFGMSEEDFEANVRDALEYPKEILNKLSGQGRLTKNVVPYKGFGIFERTDGKYDVYDKFLRIWKAGCETVEEAKQHIDETVEDKDFKKRFKEGMSKRPAKEYIDIGGLHFAHFVDPSEENEEDRDYWEVTRGGSANEGAGEFIGQYSTLKEAADAMIKEKRLRNDIIDPPTLEALREEYSEIMEGLEEAKQDLENAKKDREKFEPTKKEYPGSLRYKKATQYVAENQQRVRQYQQALREIEADQRELYSPMAKKLRNIYDL